MRRFLEVILALTITIMLTGCGIKFGVESRKNEWFESSSNNKSNDTNYSSSNIDISESIDGITKLDISIDASNIDINYYDGDNLEISGVLSKYSKGVKTEKSSNKFIIKEEVKKSGNIASDAASKIEIRIPRVFKGNLEIDFGFAECKIHDLELNDIVINGGVGSLSLDEISFNKLDLESGVGEVSLETKKKTGNIKIEGGVGETNISLGDINGDLEFQGGMGSATIKVPENAPIDINTDSGIGNVKIRAKTSNEEKYKFDIEVGIGSVEITN
ncbi:DUF4097 family beta strand repeat protein [Clostridium sp. Sa3CUN1]|uniref:DUF4097 family beta strand repeat protein n=1 Tax=Clostridium gallinarum TaxID=2762246 RepID=A0ABR8Q593_9CLOT|nr:DUF4097 family beta strand repeat-containing protein [Clostridium gallinarum]MBD7915605.1 DUF4097 family beta strand repeat protein [Clostridium gallinarum]